MSAGPKVCAVPRCQNEGTLLMRDTSGAVWSFCPPCAAEHAERAAKAGGPGYVPVDESEQAAQMPLGA